jgi:hypothetical protein
VFAFHNESDKVSDIEEDPRFALPNRHVDVRNFGRPQTTMVTCIWTVFQVLLILESVWCVAIALPQPDVRPVASQNGRLLLPDEDSFYDAPPDFQNALPGSILRSRIVPNGITLDNKHRINPENAWQFLYRTQNSVGEPSVSVVTVIKPYEAKSKHLLSYAMFSVRTEWIA